MMVMQITTGFCEEDQVWYGMCVGHIIRSVICDPEGNADAGGSAIMSIFFILFFRLGEIRPGHALGKTANVVLQRDILPFELVMVGLDHFDPFGQGVEAGLENHGMSWLSELAIRNLITKGPS